MCKCSVHRKRCIVLRQNCLVSNFKNIFFQSQNHLTVWNSQCHAWLTSCSKYNTFKYLIYHISFIIARSSIVHRTFVTSDTLIKNIFIELNITAVMFQINVNGYLIERERIAPTTAWELIIKNKREERHADLPNRGIMRIAKQPMQ